MTGAFACCPRVCPPCSRAAVEIQRSKKSADWAAAIGEIVDDKQRECVREYLRGVWLRGKQRGSA